LPLHRELATDPLQLGVRLLVCWFRTRVDSSSCSIAVSCRLAASRISLAPLALAHNRLLKLRARAFELRPAARRARPRRPARAYAESRRPLWSPSRVTRVPTAGSNYFNRETPKSGPIDDFSRQQTTLCSQSDRVRKRLPSNPKDIPQCVALSQRQALYEQQLVRICQDARASRCSFDDAVSRVVEAIHARMGGNWFTPRGLEELKRRVRAACAHDP
jgi:hypothetical protein